LKTLLILGLLGGVAAAQTVNVTGTVAIAREGRPQGNKPDRSTVVVWLTAATGGPAGPPRPQPRRFEMRQQHKCFEPHMLAIPAGSTVSFPNLDPFFHNVFSMFDGKRFDLGLYEAGASHSVVFDRPGVCYIFCNVHPEMSGLVVVLDTPYYAVTDRKGEYTMEGVAPGRYVLSVWNERCKPEAAGDFPRTVSISPENAALAPIRLLDTGQFFIPHKNKYGADYDTAAPKGPIYK
jgi:plastocyanin